LHGLPYTIRVSERPLDALKVLEKEHVDVIISDLSMPQMNGLELLAKVADRWPHVRRMMLTGYVDRETVREALEEGRIEHFFTKPWDTEEIKKELDKIVHGGK